MRYLYIFVFSSTIYVQAEELVCYGHEELCDRKYNEVCFASSHNTMSNEDDGWFPPDNKHNITSQLQYGVRGLALDLHYHKHSIYLCHKYCELGSKSLFDGLLEIKDFMDEHPNEIIYIFFESYVSNFEVAEMIISAGLSDRAYAHNATVGWPTLRQMIESSKTLIVTSDRGGFDATPPWMHFAYNLGHYSGPVTTRDENGLLDKNAMDCWAGQIKGKPHKLYWLNHFGLAPFTIQALSESINYNPFLRERAFECWEEASHIPNFYSLTFVEQSDLMEVVDAINGFE